MEWKRVLLCVSAIVGHLVLTSAQLLCNSSQYSYSPTSCLEVRKDKVLSNQAAQLNCTSDGLTGLATFEDYGQFEALQRFVNVLLKDGDVLWLGYYYDSSGDVRLRGSEALSQSTAINDSQNFRVGGVMAGAGVCLAIGRDGLLIRRLCTDMLPYACFQDQAPRVTSITIDGSRFLTRPETRTLTCNYQPANANVSWLRNSILVSDSEDENISTSLGQSNLTIRSFTMQGGSAADLFECVVRTSVGGVVSEAIGLVEEANGTNMPAPTISSIDTTPPRNDIRTGSSVTLVCISNNTMANYSWFLNGSRVESATGSTFLVDSFRGGFYQCRSALSTGENTVYTIRLDARDSPGPDESISAISLSRTSILVSWSPPMFSRDPLLLRYTLFYTVVTPRNTFSLSTAQSVSNLLPVLRDGSVSERRTVEYVLPNLEAGTEYWLSVRASYMDIVGQNSTYIAFSSTYGHVPVDPVVRLVVSRTPNNKSLLAEWDKLETALPDGRVAFYQVEYRNKGKDISMTAQIASSFDFFSILDVEDASAYEVRVRVGVQVSNFPPEFEVGEPTEWVSADRIVEAVPSPPPTLPVRPRLSDGEVAAIAIVVCVAFLVALVLIVGFVYLVMQRKGKDQEDNDSRGRTQSFKVLKKNEEVADGFEKEGTPV